MTDDDFSSWLEAQEPALKAWGEYVVAKVIERVGEEIGLDRLNQIFKVGTTPRVKATTSALIKKAKYEFPQEQMTDLIGARFVVLLRSDIEIVARAITTFGGWAPRLDRSPDEESKSAPSSFHYQSMHFLIRNTRAFTSDRGTLIPEGTTCEVQIRTLLQHAYAELTHDRIYKGKVVPKSVERLVARCMALMETTDDMFCRAVDELERVKKTRETFGAVIDALDPETFDHYVPTADDPEASEILDTYWHLIEPADVAEIGAVLTPFVKGKIKQRKATQALFAMPIVLVVYWLAARHRISVRELWPNPELGDELERVFSDLGS